MQPIRSRMFVAAVVVAVAAAGLPIQLGGSLARTAMADTTAGAVPSQGTATAWWSGARCSAGGPTRTARWDGTRIAQPAPVSVVGISNALAVAVGRRASCAVLVGDRSHAGATLATTPATPTRATRCLCRSHRSRALSRSPWEATMPASSSPRVRSGAGAQTPRAS